jgi:hypothetical protein
MIQLQYLGDHQADSVPTYLAHCYASALFGLSLAV